jgi:hypothetical protein
MKMPYNYYGPNYMPTNYNPYMQNQRIQEQYQQTQPMQYTRPAVLQGKTVDNIEVVRAIDIPLDGSVSYFPLADGTAIVSKQLQQDGTSRLIVYKALTGEEKQAEPKYITESDLKAQFNEFASKDIKDIREELKSLKKKIRELTSEEEKED